MRRHSRPKTRVTGIHKFMFWWSMLATCQELGAKTECQALDSAAIQLGGQIAPGVVRSLGGPAEEPTGAEATRFATIGQWAPWGPSKNGNSDRRRRKQAYRAEERRGGNWGKWLVVGAILDCGVSREKEESTKGIPRGLNHEPYGSTHFPPIRAGGGQSGTTKSKRDALSSYTADGAPVSLGRWAGWCGAGGALTTAATIEDLMGQSVSAATKGNYQGQFRQWTVHRSVNGLTPYIGENNLTLREEEDSVMAYTVLSLGPLAKNPSTVNGHLGAIGYFHKLRSGVNPLAEMNRLQLLIKGMMRSKGPTARKLPTSVEDLRTLRGLLDLKDTDQMILWATTLLGWFFMLRMGEYLTTNSRNCNSERRPISTSDIEPRCRGEPTEWGPHVDEVSVFISGSKTDWLNQGCIRSHSKIESGSPNVELCVVRALIGVFKAFPAKLRKHKDLPFATWKNGSPIPSTHVAATLRAAVFKNGNNPQAFSLHSLRAGGATALYRATGDIELVARFGRWKSKSISAYLWESHEMMEGLGQKMVAKFHTLRKATKRLKEGEHNINLY